jgi:hypothetical protein
MNRAKIIPKIKTLLKKADSKYNSNEEERKACIAKANDLAKKHGIDIDELLGKGRKVREKMNFNDFLESMQIVAGIDEKYCFKHDKITITFIRTFTSTTWSFGNTNMWFDNFTKDGAFKAGYEYYEYLIDVLGM